jgi:hypothetical protein
VVRTADAEVSPCTLSLKSVPFQQQRKMSLGRCLFYACFTSLVGVLIGAVVWHVLCVIFGAALFSDHQYSFATLMGLIVAQPLCAARLSQTALGDQAPLRSPHLWLLLPSCGGVLGAWAGAYPLPLDWNTVMQVARFQRDNIFTFLVDRSTLFLVWSAPRAATWRAV